MVMAPSTHAAPAPKAVSALLLHQSLPIPKVPVRSWFVMHGVAITVHYPTSGRYSSKADGSISLVQPPTPSTTSDFLPGTYTVHCIVKNTVGEMTSKPAAFWVV